MYRRDARGFTLLEVLIVVGILALLAALVVPRFFGASESAKRSLAMSQIGPTGSAWSRIAFAIACNAWFRRSLLDNASVLAARRAA